ncbi:CBF/Mak21 family-domain-containing protein [Limtongia smithiae]|uniref:CBF/Mak21 family-domain-containing protein n=1 Tax=Limtongia smithiae TaxID=1125753 RepID=UPI0034CD4F66
MPIAVGRPKKITKASPARGALASVTNGRPAKKHTTTTSVPPTPTAETIFDLEQQIARSTENYNNLVYLVHYLDDVDSELALLAAVSLFRSFSRFMAAGMMAKVGGEGAQATLQKWLGERYSEFKTKAVRQLAYGEGEVQTSALTILMRLVKEESQRLGPAGEYYFAKKLYRRVIGAVLGCDNDDLVLEFVATYVDKFDDLRYYFLLYLSERPTDETTTSAETIIQCLCSLTNLPTTAEAIEEFYVPLADSSTKNKILKLAFHQNAFEQAWLSTLRLPLSAVQYKFVLQVMHVKIVPFMRKPTLLMDFLTDSYNQRDSSVPLLALNGLFMLMQKYNLDYPNFYEKLYRLLDRDIMHVKYRSRFFRQLDLFLSSSHLPASLIASFIKRIARLSISAPPAAIVIVIPFIYNLLKRHNTCNLLLQRVSLSPADLQKLGSNDPFNNDETDPNKTGALESSAWELVVLQSHYHPNVATLAKIFSEPFHKPSYNIEDFMDHSYGTMLDAEFSKSIRAAPAVEYEPLPMLPTGHSESETYLSGWDIR